MGKVLVAYSGGVDSTFLLHSAIKTLGETNVLAVIARSPTYPEVEVEAAHLMCEELGGYFQLIDTDEFADEKFLANTKERCYFCKKELFAKLKMIAEENGIKFVADGSNVDDLADFRPGNKAKEELGIKSPLQEAGLTKEDIRQLSKEAGLVTWDKPSMACLASRVPYGTRLTTEILEKVRHGEKFLKECGFKQTRVRHHHPIARIEVGQDELGKMMEEEMIKAVNKQFEELGYVYVTLDLKGFRSGSMNEGFFFEGPKE